MADPNVVSRILATIRGHESGGNYTILNRTEHVDRSKVASGAYQFTGPTWRGVAAQSGVPGATNYQVAADAPPDVQDAVASYYVSSILDQHGGNPDAVWATWYSGGYDPNNLDYVPAPDAGNTTTVRTYINQANNMMNGTAGGGDTATAAAATADPMSDPAVQAFLQAVAANPDALVKARFPTYALYLSDPEMGPLLTQAAKENWDSTRLQTAVQATNFWRTTTDSQRQWDNLRSVDPASADKQVQSQLLSVSQQFAQLGFTPDQSTLWKITNDSLRNGWDAKAITNAITTALPEKYSGKALAGGDIAGTMQTLKQSASDYFMPLTDDTAYDWAKRIAGGTLDQGAVNGIITNWAKQNYSWLSSTIDQGGTLKDYFAPMQQQIGSIMGTSADAVDIMNDPTWHQLANLTDPDGKRRAPTIQDAQALARSSPGYKYTADANNRQASIYESLSKTFTGA